MCIRDRSPDAKIQQKIQDLLITRALARFERGERTEYRHYNELVGIGHLEPQEMRRLLFHYVRALCFLTSYERDLALKEINEVLKIYPDLEDGLLMKAKLLWHMGRRVEGNAVFWHFVELFPGHKEVAEFLKTVLPKAEECLGVARTALLTGDYSKSLVYIAKGLEEYPNNVRLLMLRGFIQRKKGAYEDALNDLEGASHYIRTDDEQKEIKDQISLTYNDMAIYLYESGRYEDAIAIFNEALLFKADDWGVHVNRGDCYRNIRKNELALADYYRAADIAGERASREIKMRIAMVLYSQGVSKFNSGDYEGTIYDLTECLKFQSNYALYFTTRARAYVQQGRVREAYADYLKAQELDPANEEAKNFLMSVARK
eukprot:TRINITY_DN4421_c0_g2_i1.p1 TRINITY_DN4421_c0_g2~~TRINITY_DN4421_c0_g2_i1.p1  ORF type:complete len:373 (-),score=95.68 TRINITY_DN4421_c0_g2_i1:140-1258(-)